MIRNINQLWGNKMKASEINPNEETTEKISALEKENAELKAIHESDKKSIFLITEKGKELEKQIEKMKCCVNCKHWEESFDYNSICNECEKLSEWELL